MPANKLSGGFNGNMQKQKLIDLGAGTATTDGINKGQVDTALAAKISTAAMGVANGVAALDASGKAPTAQIPSLGYMPTAHKGQANGAATLDASGKVGQLPAASAPSSILSGTDHGVWIDLNSTSEPTLRAPHRRGEVPAERDVFFEPVADPGLDLDAACLDHVKYLAAQSSATEMAFSVKLRAGFDTTGQRGQLRVLAFAA